MSCARLLLVEDDADVAAALRPVLESEGYEVRVISRGDEACVEVTRKPFEVVLTDQRLPGCDGLEVIRQLRREHPRTPVILMTAHASTETAIEAMKLGAFDYVLKPFDMPELIAVLKKATEAGRRMSEPVALGAATPTGAALIGQSRPMQIVYKEIGRVAARPVSVLVLGETGTGKELIARAIYQHSERSGQPFVAVNCAAIPETLLESELFGHERGAFTGADVRRIGRFEQAHGGTLFLDEIGDLSSATQAKLLRVLQERTFQRLGGRETITVDVRILAATHRDLEHMMAAREFREDLYYRLAVSVICLPPLRDRREDIPELVGYFARRHGPEMGNATPVFLPEALAVLAAQSWPGNVRQLENTVRQALLQSQSYPVTAEHVNTALEPAPGEVSKGGRDSLRDLVEDSLRRVAAGEIQNIRERLQTALDRELLTQAMAKSAGNLTHAARWLGLTRVTLREKLRQLGLRPPAGDPGED